MLNRCLAINWSSSWLDRWLMFQDHITMCMFHATLIKYGLGTRSLFEATNLTCRGLAIYMHQSTRSYLVKVMALRLYSAWLLPEPMLTYCPSDPHLQTWVNYNEKNFLTNAFKNADCKKTIRHLVQASIFNVLLHLRGRSSLSNHAYISIINEQSIKHGPPLCIYYTHQHTSIY